MYEKQYEFIALLYSFFFHLDQDIIQIPLAIVILGSLACTFNFIVLIIILNDRTRGKKKEHLFCQK